MSDESPSQNPLDALADEFVERIRAGETPNLFDYCERYPSLADEIRRIFPTLVMMERARPTDLTVAVRAAEASGDAPNLERLGDYRILREIGRGGMGIVYEAEQQSLCRRVALKILPPHALLRRHTLERFQREARAAARLHHTNIVPVFGVGEEAGVHYYVMQYIEGQGIDHVLAELRRLRRLSETDTETPNESARLTPTEVEVEESLHAARAKRRASQPLPKSGSVSASGSSHSVDSHSLSQTGSAYWQSVARIGVQVAEAIDYAYAQGVLHRDIKPSNLLLDMHGTVWVTDFGLAKSDDSEDLTNTGDLLGTLRYLAPERLRGEVTLRGDLYALGATLYEMLTLRPLFEDRDRHQLHRRILDEEPRRPREIDAEIPADLETIVLKAISKEPGDRYPSAAELIADLRNFMDDKPILARPISSWERTWRWCRRNPRTTALLGTIATLLAAVTIIATTSALLLKQSRDASRTAEGIAVGALKQKTEAEKASRQDLFRAYMSEAQANLLSGSAAQRSRGMIALRNAMRKVPLEERSKEQHAELCDLAVAHMVLPKLERVTEPREVPFYAGNMAISKDLDLTAESVPTGSHTIVRRLSKPDERVELEIAGPDQRQFMTVRHFSPSGRWLAEIRNQPDNVTDRQLVVWDWRAKRIVFRDESISSFRLCFHPNDRVLLYGKDSAVLRVLDVERGEVLSESPRLFFRGHDMALSEDGELLAVCTPELHAEVFKLDEWKCLARIDYCGEIECVAWHPRERKAAFGNRAGRIFLWNYDDRSIRALDVGSDVLARGGVVQLEYSSSGKYLAASRGGQKSDIWQMHIERIVGSLDGKILGISPDERQLAVRVDHDTFVKLEFAESKSNFRLPCHCEAAEFSPDGNWIVSGGSAGVQVFSASTGRMYADLRLDACGPVCFDPSGGSLYTFGMFSHAQRWPVVLTEEGRSAQIGPPESLQRRSTQQDLRGAEPLKPHHFGRHTAVSQDGRLLVLADARFNRILVSERGKDESLRELAPFPSIRRVAISPDGRWAAGVANAGIHHSGVFRVSDGTKVLEKLGHGYVAFSDDGCRFSTCSLTEVCIYRTEDWTLERVFPVEGTPNWDTACVAFQSGGKLLAVADRQSRVRLFDLESGRVVVNLTHSLTDLASPFWLRFSRDGRRLAVTRLYFDVVIWDLANLRQELIAEGLDVPELPGPAPKIATGEERATDRAGQVESVQVDRGSQLPIPEHWHLYWQRLALGERLKGNWPDAIDDLNRGLYQIPSPVGNDRARHLLLRAECHLKNGSAHAAMRDLTEAHLIVPDDGMIRRTMARYQLLGPIEIRAPEAAYGLISVLATSADATPEDLLLYAVAQVRLGRDEVGLSTFEKIVRDDPGNLLAKLFSTLAQHRLSRTDALRATWDDVLRLREERVSLTDEEKRAFSELEEQVKASLSSSSTN